ncbi:MAG: hypothetical protein ACYDH9_23460 [Limisphaerales bacterium]
MSTRPSNPKPDADAGRSTVSGFKLATGTFRWALAGFLLLVFGTNWARGQTAPIPKPVPHIQAAKKPSDKKFRLASIIKPDDALGRDGGRYRGFLADLIMTRHPLRMMKPRQSESTADNNPNAMIDWHTGRIEGVALLSIRF